MRRLYNLAVLNDVSVSFSTDDIINRINCNVKFSCQRSPVKFWVTRNIVRANINCIFITNHGSEVFFARFSCARFNCIFRIFFFGRPLQIFDAVICGIVVAVVNKRLIFRIRNKSFSDDSMDTTKIMFSIFAQIYA